MNLIYELEGPSQSKETVGSETGRAPDMTIFIGQIGGSWCWAWANGALHPSVTTPLLTNYCVIPSRIFVQNFTYSYSNVELYVNIPIH